MRFATFLFKNLLRRRLRSLLTGFGVAVAVGATVALLGISEGFERSSVDSFEKRGVDIVVVAGGVLDQLSSDLQQTYADKILAVPGVKAVGPGLLEIVSYSRGHSDISVLIQGWEPDSFLFDDLELISGRRLQQNDKRTVMLGATLAKNIGKSVGDIVVIQREEFEVVGVYQSFSVYENGAAILPLAELQEVMFRQNSVTGFSVVVEPTDKDEGFIDAVCEQINGLTDERGRLLGLSAQPTREYVSGSMHIRMAHAMAWLTSMIAIVVGAIGVLNTMVMSVVERIREISILRAIGWRKSRVVNMIVGESLMLSLAGAVLGAAGAAALTSWLTTLPAASGFIQGDIALTVIAKGFLLALVVGLVGAAYPAYRAAQLLPSEGLRHE